LTEILGTWEDTHVNFIHDITANTKSGSVRVKAPKVFLKRKKEGTFDFCFIGRSEMPFVSKTCNFDS
jgi:hypothetical protein